MQDIRMSFVFSPRDVSEADVSMRGVDELGGETELPVRSMEDKCNDFFFGSDFDLDSEGEHDDLHDFLVKEDGAIYCPMVVVLEQDNGEQFELIMRNQIYQFSHFDELYNEREDFDDILGLEPFSH